MNRLQASMDKAREADKEASQRANGVALGPVVVAPARRLSLV